MMNSSLAAPIFPGSVPWWVNALFLVYLAALAIRWWRNL
jgi:hypothetical protein